jgi:hypothetical protein
VNALKTAVAAFRITGAAQVEVGCSREEPGSWWWASARYVGRRFFVEYRPSGEAALLALGERLLEMGKCTGCDRPVQVYRRDVVTVIDSRACLWTPVEDRLGEVSWVAGCAGSFRVPPPLPPSGI